MSRTDPLAGSSWSDPETVAAFSRSPPNQVLMGYDEAAAARQAGRRALDLGCGAGRNAVPLAQRGWTVLGTDLSWPMLVAGAARARDAGVEARTAWALSPMERLPLPDASVDLVVAHGVWNLAPSSDVFRGALAEAARVARPGAGLFVFTFPGTPSPTMPCRWTARASSSRSSRAGPSAFLPPPSSTSSWPGWASCPTAPSPSPSTTVPPRESAAWAANPR